MSSNAIFFMHIISEIKLLRRVCEFVGLTLLEYGSYLIADQWDDVRSVGPRDGRGGGGVWEPPGGADCLQ